MKQVCVIGAGITGITTAYELARDGYQVTVLDKHPYVAMQTSYANGGQLSVSNSEVWTTWPTVWKGMKWMFKKDAPLLFNPRPSFPKMAWMGGFLMNTLMGNQRAHTQETVRLGLIAREQYFKIADETGIEFNLLKKGILHFYRNDKSFESGRKSCDLFQSMGVNRYAVSADEVLDIEPNLAKAEHKIVGGTYTPDDASGDIHKFCSELSKVLKIVYGVNFIYDTTVTDIQDYHDGVMITRTGDRYEINQVYDYLVICGGAESSHLSAMLHDHINVYPVKGYSITVNTAGRQSYSPTVSLLDEELKIVSSTYGTRLRVAGTAELADWNLDIKADRIKPLVDWVRHSFPELSVEDVKPWAGLRPMTPSMLPICRPSKASDRIVLNTGHGHLGWTLAPATALATLDHIRAIKD